VLKLQLSKQGTKKSKKLSWINLAMDVAGLLESNVGRQPTPMKKKTILIEI